MIRQAIRKSYVAGFTVIEAVISVGVLAAAIPLVFAAMAGSGETGMYAKAESRSCVMMAACMDELTASRQGKSALLPASSAGQAFPASGKLWALAFSDSGKILGLIDKAGYDQGVRTAGGEKVYYIARMEGVAVVKLGAPTLVDVRVTFEYPAVVRSGKRKTLEYNTRIP